MVIKGAMSRYFEDLFKVTRCIPSKTQIVAIKFFKLKYYVSDDVFSLVHKNSMEIMVRNGVREILPEVRIE